VAAPFNKLSIVPITTTLLPEECTPNPPTFTKCFSELSFTSGTSFTTLISFSPEYFCSYNSLISEDLKVLFKGMLTAR
jgi:hypothetical protein